MYITPMLYYVQEEFRTTTGGNWSRIKAFCIVANQNLTCDKRRSLPPEIKTR